jgi:hypothetical protein
VTQGADDRNAALAQATMQVALGAMAEDDDRVAAVVDGIGDTYGNRGVFCVCAGLAELVVQANRMRETGAAQAQAAGYPGDGWWGVEFQGDDGRVDPEEGFGLEGDDAIHERAVVFVGRFFTACLNRDLTIATSLFFAPVQAGDDEQLVANVWHLCGMAGAMLRAAEQIDFDATMGKWGEAGGAAL